MREDGKAGDVHQSLTDARQETLSKQDLVED